jgi:hypothetical protein
MEYDADRYEARVAGSDTFASTTHRLRQLSAAYQMSQETVMGFLVRGKFPNNLPGVVLRTLDSMPQKLQRKLDKRFDKETTSLFDTHPSDRDRIRRAEAVNAPGVFHADGPASLLFQHFDALTKNVTWDLYCAMGASLKPQDMDEIDELFNPTKRETTVPDENDVPIPLI